MAAEHLFLPGFGACASLYRHGLPAGWVPLEPPSFARGGGSFDFRRDWLLGELAARDGPVTLGGHSMGAALVIAAAARRPELVAGMLLISPAGLPLTKAIRESLRDFGGQIARRRYPLGELGRSSRNVLRAPRSALRLAREVRALDLCEEMRGLRAAQIPTTVVGCASDTLTSAAHCRTIARLLGAPYRELALTGGHMWMLNRWTELERQLLAAD